MVITALLLGFIGSLHCFGMCSPLIMAVTALKPSVIMSRLTYNAGRVMTYAILGSIAASATYILPDRNYQNLFSILLGTVLLFVGIGGIKNFNIPIVSNVLQSISQKLKGTFSQFVNQKNHGSLFFLGSLNGMLPCGLTFLALSYCLTLRGPLDGFNFMLLFGAGTLPVMLGFTTIIQFVAKRFHFSMRNISTGMIIISGVVLIARVFVIHIPQASSFQEGVMDIVMCR